MARLILLFMLFAALAFAVAGAVALVRALRPRAPATPNPAASSSTEDPMPATLRVASFVVLLLLLLGVAGGWLGPS